MEFIMSRTYIDLCGINFIKMSHALQRRHDAASARAIQKLRLDFLPGLLFAGVCNLSRPKLLCLFFLFMLMFI